MKKSIYSIESDLLRKWLTEKRHKAKFSQRQFASTLQIHYSIVSKIETGARQINVVELIEYCKILNCDPVEIINQLKLI